MNSSELRELLNRVSHFDKRAIARVISEVEKNPLHLFEELRTVKNRGKVVGFTGPPGAGKSSLLNRLTLSLLEEGKRVGVLAIDPSSPFTGGALLGDRVRFKIPSHLSQTFYLRSMASRGRTGGLSWATYGAVKVLQKAGCDFIFIETVGAGQNDVEINDYCDLTVLVLVPEGGDSIQMLKAGIMEIADLFIINKGDRGGSKLVEAELRSILMMSGKGEVLRVSAKTGENLNKLLEKIKGVKKECERDEERLLIKEFLKYISERALKKTLEKDWKGKPILEILGYFAKMVKEGGSGEREEEVKSDNS